MNGRSSLEAASALDEIPNEVLKAALRTRLVHDETGRSLELSSNIAPHLAAALYRAVLRAKPSLVIEVGMAHGISTLAILTALRELGQGGQLLSIDPGQTTEWKGAGLASVRCAGLESFHRLIESPDFLALPNLLATGTRVDFAYIDGWHSFDYVLLDLFYLDKMLSPGGAIGFNDCGMRAVHKVLQFIRTHRRYCEMDVGLERDFRSKYPGYSVIKRLAGRSNEDRYFTKLQDWEPGWDFYARF